MVILELRDQPALIQAIFAGDLAATEAILRSNEEVNLLDAEKRTALHAAAFKADAGITAALLQAGARVNAKDAKWVTPLHRACSINADKVVALLLNASADAGARDRLWQTPLHVAAANNAYECVELLADHIPNIDVTDRSGKTALHHAAHNGHTYIVDLLISKGSSVNASDKKYFRPLHFAAQMGHCKTIDFLIKCGADINASDCNQCTPLHVAAANGNDSVCRVLLNAGADKDAQNTYGNTPLHIACLNGQQLVCQDLVNAGADPEAVNFQGQTPLHISAASAHGAECMMYLLSQKVDVNKRSLDGRTPLHMTAIHGKFTRSTSLIDHGAIIDCTDKNGCTPLHITAQYGHDLLATTLMSFGADPSFKGYEGRTPLHMCCLSGNVECCRKFLIAGVDLNAVDNTGKTPIHYAAYKGSFECIDLLVSNGAKFCEKDDIGRVPLHYAAAQGHYQCVFTLVGIGTPLNVEDNQGCTPLHLAAGYDLESKCVEYFLEHKADPLSRDKKGFTPLHYAAAGNNTSAGLLVLSSFNYKCSVEKLSTTLVTPLHLAAKVGNYKILKKLIEDGADVNAQEEQGITPLMLAAREGQLECAITLVEAGASVTICDKINNMTAVHYCARNGYHECLQEMLQTERGKESIEMTDSLQRTPLMLAVSSNHVECVKVLLNYSMDVEKTVNMVDNDSHSSLVRAVALGHSKIVQLLLTQKAKANIVDVNGKSVIHLAAACGHLTCLQILVDYLEPHEAAAMDRQECTALHWACYRGNASCVDFLLKKGIFETLSGNKFSAVHCACYSGSVQCLELLLRYFGKDIVNLQDSRKRYPLHICALHGHTETAKLLLDQGATLDVLDEDERTPFTSAAQFGQNEIIELFLKFDVDKTHQDKHGNTALHWACLMKHTSTAVLLLKDMKDYNVIHSINKENKTALHLAARNGLVYVTRELLRKGASVYAVDSEGHTPALCCAPNNQVAQCLALILLHSTNGASGESDPNKSLSSFLQIAKQKSLNQPNSSIPKKSVQTQTDKALLKNSDAFAPDKNRSRFNPPIWSKRPKTLTPSNSSCLKPLFKSSWKKNQGAGCEDDCFLIDNSEQNGKSDGPEIESNKGLNLHRSFSDMSISSHNGGKINLEETLKVRNLKELSDRKKGCRECLLWQRRCSDCTLRHLLRQHLQGKRSPREFNEFLSKLLNESSTEYRQKLLRALEALGKGFENPYNKDLTPDLRQVVRLGKNKKNLGRNRRMLCKMDAGNLASMIRKTPSVKITLTQPRSFQETCKTAETSSEQKQHNIQNVPKHSNDTHGPEILQNERNESISNEPIRCSNENEALQYQEFVTELLNENNNLAEPVFRTDFLKELQGLKLVHDNEKDFLLVVKDHVKKLLNEGKSSEMYKCERFLTDDDVFKHIENLMKTMQPLGGLKNAKEADMGNVEELTNIERESSEEDIENIESELCPLIIDKSELELTKEEVEDEICCTEHGDLIEDYILPPIKVNNCSNDPLSGCISVIPVQFIIDEKNEELKATRIYMIDKDSGIRFPESAHRSGETLDVFFMTEENDSFQHHVYNKEIYTVGNQSDTFTSKAGSQNESQHREASNENSEFSDNEFY
ncbi:serine/threonine-protein phosphatase 6 regulatory ankyrin repeat subunit A-like isoform X2 [Coccinella septempunctata]|uniref:serine/threonine-protein phosphatase 6 regulatory ankyrin repeat subunit A-like isoform X2 n=1 Tax=Coccinella septempunctata TaxID=41139 RepID=UPI001D067C13|nr:serine/threonine-protein phosphatase 6 regulatory ankyrin repeat subunit A-like isoform X2 [Coccinella septempunctata]